MSCFSCKSKNKLSTYRAIDISNFGHVTFNDSVDAEDKFGVSSGKVVLHRIIGHGSFGSVYRGSSLVYRGSSTEQELPREFAVKFINLNALTAELPKK